MGTQARVSRLSSCGRPAPASSGSPCSQELRVHRGFSLGMQPFRAPAEAAPLPCSPRGCSEPLPAPRKPLESVALVSATPPRQVRAAALPSPEPRLPGRACESVDGVSQEQGDSSRSRPVHKCCSHSLPLWSPERLPELPARPLPTPGPCWAPLTAQPGLQGAPHLPELATQSFPVLAACGAPPAASRLPSPELLLEDKCFWGERACGRPLSKFWEFSFLHKGRNPEVLGL